MRSYTSDATRTVHGGRKKKTEVGIVNEPVWHASTVLFPTLADLRASEQNHGKRQLAYGRRGTPTSWALEDALCELEGGFGTNLFPTGINSITSVLQALSKTGDHILVTDSSYGPTRHFCDKQLSRFNVETEYYDPLIGAGIADLIRPNTSIVVVEAPGSLTFEIQDIPAIAAEAHKAGALVVMDNTWATALFYPAFDHGVDVTVNAGTKYQVGHSDVMFGFATCKDEAVYNRVHAFVGDTGLHHGPDDSYLALRGLRTMEVRLQRHQESALVMADWLKQLPFVQKVLHPALPDCPGHDIFKRDFKGSSGLFSFIMDPVNDTQLAALIDDLELYGMGYSWGGYESLILPANPARSRTASPWTETGQLIRLHIGLEDIDDLKSDLMAGFNRMQQAG